jgi:hypothetical protein
MANGTLAIVGSPGAGGTHNATAEMMRSASNAQQLLAGAAAAAGGTSQQGLSPSMQHQQPKLPVATRADMLADTGKVCVCVCASGLGFALNCSTDPIQ